MSVQINQPAVLIAQAQTTQTIFTNQTPSNPNATDNTTYELGLKFQSDTAGQITAIRYWKAASETGSHVGRIWSSTGTLLASVTFTNETASGWQQQALSTALSINANTTYVVSVNVNSYFAVTNNGLASSVVSGDLKTVADGNNGVYGSSGSLPTNSYQNSNYFRDIVFVPTSQTQMTETIFTNQTPSSPNATDNTTYELGLKFQSTKAGQITAIRYWKAASETGSHVGRIWSSTGTLLTSVTFSNETASGWQQQALSTALNINANTTYVVSVNVNSYFAVTNNGLATSVVKGDLKTVADGNNGVYGSLGSLPTNSYQNSNYFRDIVFVPSTTPPPSNAISVENQQTGTTNWKITNPVSQSAPEIAGYASATSVNKGGSLDIKVSLAQPGQFTIDVYRLGYYAGNGGRLLKSSGSLNGITQPDCTITDSTTKLIECNWSTSYTLAVGSNWTSGLYIAKLTDSSSGKQSQVWFVVRDDNSTSDILFQSSFTTFLAYSNTGGYSLYAWNSIGGQKALKVSYDRPFSETTTLTGEFNNITRWEYNMVRWLESQSYDVTYVTNMDIQSNSLQLLKKHKAFLSVGHDEYWSLDERNNVQQARDAGVNLGFFSANTAYWRVRFENGSVGGTKRVMVCYKDVATSSEPTTEFRDPLNNLPESALLGVMYIGDIDVVYGGFDFVVQNSSDSYYANTGLKNGDTLSALVGFEWDAVNTNASPSGLVVLSQSQTSQTLSDSDLEGFPSGANPQTANAVRYTAASGAKVFSTGSIQWVWGLDSDGVNPPRQDNRAQQIAVNVLASMGVKPLTPSSYIVVPS